MVSEAAARGTPVVALARGSAPELIVHGVTGMLCRDEEEMARSIPQAFELEPDACRLHAETLFSRDLIAGQYLTVYERVLTERGIRPKTRASRPPRARPRDELVISHLPALRVNPPPDDDRPLVGPDSTIPVGSGIFQGQVAGP